MSTAVRMLTKEEALSIHAISIDRFGGLVGIRDEGLLDSAIAQPMQSFGGVEIYPTLDEKATRLAFGRTNRRQEKACPTSLTIPTA